MATYMRLTIKCVDGDDLFIDPLRGKEVGIWKDGDRAIVKVLDVNYVPPEEVDD